MTHLSSDLLQQVVSLLSSHLATESERRAFVDSAIGMGGRANTFTRQLDFSGSAYDFTVQLVRQAVDYGTLDSGENALIALLNTSKDYVGADDVAQIDATITRIQSSHRTEKTMPDKPTEKGSSNVGLILTVIGTIAGVVSMIAAVIALPQFGGTPPDPTATLPATPLVVARTSLEVREGPGPDFAIFRVLNVGSSADVIGISQDSIWYQVVLLDGSRGWVRAGVAVALVGNQGIIPVIIPTETPTPTSTPTRVPSNTPTLTATTPPTSTNLPPSATSVPTNTPVAVATTAVVNTAVPTTGVAVASYPCNGTIINPDSGATVINVVYLTASTSSQRRSSIRVNTQVELQREEETAEGIWFLIFEGSTRLGWVQSRYVTPDHECPSTND